MHTTANERLLLNMAQPLTSVNQACVSIQTAPFMRGLTFKSTVYTCGIIQEPVQSDGAA